MQKKRGKDKNRIGKETRPVFHPGSAQLGPLLFPPHFPLGLASSAAQPPSAGPLHLPLPSLTALPAPPVSSTFSSSQPSRPATHDARTRDLAPRPRSATTPPAPSARRLAPDRVRARAATPPPCHAAERRAQPHKRTPRAPHGATRTPLARRSALRRALARPGRPRDAARPHIAHRRWRSALPPRARRAQQPRRGPSSA